MQLTCKACAASYVVPDSMFEPGQKTAVCTRCGTTIFLEIRSGKASPLEAEGVAARLSRLRLNHVGLDDGDGPPADRTIISHFPELAAFDVLPQLSAQALPSNTPAPSLSRDDDPLEKPTVVGAILPSNLPPRPQAVTKRNATAPARSQADAASSLDPDFDIRATQISPDRVKRNGPGARAAFTEAVPSALAFPENRTSGNGVYGANGVNGVAALNKNPPPPAPALTADDMDREAVDGSVARRLNQAAAIKGTAPIATGEVTRLPGKSPLGPESLRGGGIKILNASPHVMVASDVPKHSLKAPIIDETMIFPEGEVAENFRILGEKRAAESARPTAAPVTPPPAVPPRTASASNATPTTARKAPVITPPMGIRLSGMQLPSISGQQQALSTKGGTPVYAIRPPTYRLATIGLPIFAIVSLVPLLLHDAWSATLLSKIGFFMAVSSIVLALIYAIRDENSSG